MTVSSGVAQSDPDDDPVEALILPEEAQTLAPREQPAPTLPPRPAPSPTGRPEGARRPAAALSTPVVDGRAVPGYEILGELGRGGMGVVYKARHLRLDRVVALKMILSGAHAGALELGRFRTEAEAVARLTHPGIVAIYEVGEHEGRPWFALEFVDGGSLSARCTGTPLPPAEAAVLVEKLADAMSHAHTRGVVHRDLKPANVLLTRAGEPKVTDFGLARELGASDGLTASGAIMGTPSYMAPEQAGGNSKAIGPAADVYALGAVLYELLTGRPPFRAASLMDTLMQVVSDDPVPPSRLQSRLPRDLETVCLKCLSKDPGRRYATADELADDLRRFRNGEPVRARPVGPAERAIKWVRRRPATAALLALLAITTATGFGLVTWKWLDADRARGEANGAREEAVKALARAREEQAKADSERSRAEAQLTRSESLLYANGIRLAERELLAGDKARAVQLLDECRRDLRGWEWHFLRRQLVLGGSAAWTGLEQPIGPVAFGPDGSLLAGGGGGNLFVLDPAGKEVRSWPGGAAVRAVAWAADGKLLASGDLAGNVAVRTAVGDSLVTIRAHTKGVTSLAFAPDGRTLASGGADALAVLWDAVTGRELHICGGHGGPVLAVAFSPDGQTLATASNDKTVKLWDVATGAARYTYREHQQSVGTVAFSPDGRHIASGRFRPAAVAGRWRGGRVDAQRGCGPPGLSPWRQATVRPHRRAGVEDPGRCDRGRRADAGGAEGRAAEPGGRPERPPPGRGPGHAERGNPAVGRHPDGRGVRAAPARSRGRRRLQPRRGTPGGGHRLSDRAGVGDGVGNGDGATRGSAARPPQQPDTTGLQPRRHAAGHGRSRLRRAAHRRRVRQGSSPAHRPHRRCRWAGLVPGRRPPDLDGWRPSGPAVGC